jgi:hypothetical protein
LDLRGRNLGKARKDCYCSRNLIWVKKSRRMRWAGNVARMIEMRNAYKILVGKPEGKRPLRRIGVDGKIILRKRGGKLWTLFIWLRIGTGGVLL